LFLVQSENGVALDKSGAFQVVVNVKANGPSSMSYDAIAPLPLVILKD